MDKTAIALEAISKETVDLVSVNIVQDLYY